MSGADKEVRRAFQRESVIAVFLQTQRYQPEMTGKLLRALAANDGLAKYSPAWQFVNRIVPEKVGRMDQASLAVHARLVAAIWNAHFDGRNLIHLVPRDPKLPILIEGTPWKGR